MVEIDSYDANMRVPPARSVVEAAERIPAEALLTTDQEVLAQWCLAQMGWPAAQQPRIELGALHDHLRSDRLVVHIPLLSDADEFERYRELGQNYGWGFGSCGSARVATFEFAVGDLTKSDAIPFEAEVQNLYESIRDAAEKQAAEARNELEEARSKTLENLRLVVARRVKIVSATSAAKVNLGIPLVGVPQARPIPVKAIGLNLEKAMERASLGVPQPTLDKAVREQVLATIRSFTEALERLPNTAKRLADLDEEALRDVLLFVINSNWRVATGEAFSGQGKTDIQLQFDGRVAFIAELKVYSGPQAIKDAVDQLSSYLVWRDTHAALVVFIRDRQDITSAIRKTHAAVKTHSRYLQQGPDRADQFVLGTLDGERTIVLDVIAVPL